MNSECKTWEIDSLRVGDKPTSKDEEGSVQVIPIYIWKVSKAFMMSKAQKVGVDEFIRSRRYDLAIEVIFKEVKRRVSVRVLKCWLELPMVKEYIGQELMKDGYWNGMDVREWNLRMCEHLEGRRSLSGVDLYCMKVLAQVRGFEERGSGGVVFNQSIRVMQSNGRE